ncbi:MAG: SipW-dependent-type signal peptide-containing protein [Candidatus Dormibacteria bacterium]|jgi:predicted ribosomally synthesized peptide with SipW-like signal peptide
MNHKILKASLAGGAFVALVAGGTTFAAFSDFGNINNNTVGAGFLKLDLNAGTGSVPLDFGHLAPNNIHANRTIWVASNDGQSVPNANLSVTFKNLKNIAAPCNTSLGKASVDPGCTVGAGDTIGGTPTTGELDKVLNFQTQYYPQFTDPQTCQAAAGTYPQPYNSIFPADSTGDLPGYIDTPFQLKQADHTTPLVLKPGQGVCIGIDTYWGSNNGSVPDNAAQGDSLTFDVHFDLTQA